MTVVRETSDKLRLSERYVTNYSRLRDMDTLELSGGPITNYGESERDK